MPSKRTIRCQGRDHTVLFEMRLGGKLYLALEKLGSGARERYRVFDPKGGQRGEMRTIHVFKRQPAAMQHLAVLKRLSQGNRNLPMILEYHTVRDTIQILTPWIEGQDLRSYLTKAASRRPGGSSPVEVFHLFRGLAHGLCQLHHQNIVHGDLKPENLLLCREPKRLVMIDFGSAWTVERTARRDPGEGLTPKYAAPELHAGRVFADFRSDQFSASVVAYEMFTADIPYDKMGGEAGRPQNRPQFAEKLIAPSQRCPLRQGLPAEIWKRIDRVVTRGLALDPDARYPNRQEWLTELDETYAELKRPVRFGRLNSLLLRGLDWLRRRGNAKE